MTRYIQNGCETHLKRGESAAGASVAISVCVGGGSDSIATGMECHGIREHALPQETGKCVIATHSAGGSC